MEDLIYFLNVNIGYKFCRIKLICEFFKRGSSMIPNGLNLQLSLSAFAFLIFSCGEKSENYYSCSLTIDGERKSASSKSACDALEKEADLSDINAEKASADSTKVSEEDSEENSDRDREKDDQDSSSADASNSAYSCSYNVNGKNYRGDTKEKCKELDEKYGLDIYRRKDVSR